MVEGQNMDVGIFVGTRPEIIKMAPIVRELGKRGVDFLFIHSGQHYDYELSLMFIEQLGLPRPDYNIRLGSATQIYQMSDIIKGVGEILKKENILIGLVHGDTNTTLASAIALNKAKAYVAHIEAGLRSYDWRMPEEYNRRLTDHLSTYLFAPTVISRENLLKENILGHIFITGNTVIDAINLYLDLALKESEILTKIPFDEYILVTAHRAENVDDPFISKNIVEALIESPLPIVYPIHPRAKKRFKEFSLLKKIEKAKHIFLLPPLGYFDFLVLMKNSKFILTDSGGIQEEATAPKIRKPVLVMRLSTERPEAIEKNFAFLVGINKTSILDAIKKTINNYKLIIKNIPKESPYGDGTAAKKIVNIIEEEITYYHEIQLPNND